jgi:hypothetical protein
MSSLQAKQRHEASWRLFQLTALKASTALHARCTQEGFRMDARRRI